MPSTLRLNPNMTDQAASTEVLRTFLALIFLLGMVPSWAGADEQGANVVDASTLNGKVMTGYQAWFRCQGDGSDQGWTHWSNDYKRLSPKTIHVDLWPDVSELPPAERYAAPGFTYEDGSPAYLFSAYNAPTVLRHFQWMRDYEIDGAWVQHFLVGFPDAPGKRSYPSHRRVIDHVIAATAQTGRVWAFSYDIAGMPGNRVYDTLTADWKRMVDEGIVAGPRYLHHQGKPVAQIWGFYYGVKSNQMDADTANRLIEFFHAPGPYAAFLVGGGGWDWRRVPDPQWQAFYRRFDAYTPWIVGNQLIDKAGISHPGTQRWADDLTECKGRGMMFIPVVYPGFSWYNLKNNAPGTTSISRRDGQFLWEQFYTLARLKVDRVYVAMFDEVDEGTAVFKLASSSRVDGPVIHRDTAYPSDWYLRLVREGSRMIRGQRPISQEIPIKP